MYAVAKRFRLSADEIVAVVPGRGSCYASDRITVDGCPVGYAYREQPDDDSDSGWRFFAGDETQEYADEPNNFAIYDVNTIANYDPEIVPLLDEPAHVQFERGGVGQPLRKVT